MQLVAQGDTSVEIVRKALPEMSRHGIPITPANYAVWFEYLSAGNRDLTGEMEKVLKHGRVTSAVIEDFYNRYINGTSDGALSDLRDGLRALLETFRSELDHVSAELGDYGGALDEFAEHLLSVAVSANVVDSAAQLARKTQTIAGRNAALRDSLLATSSDVGAMQNELAGSAAQHAPPSALKLSSSLNETFDAVAGSALSDDTHGPCLLLIDVDHFGAVIETHGATVGEQVLTGVATSLCAQVKDRDAVARLDGNLFAVLLTDLARSCGQRVADELREAVAAGAVAAPGAPDPVRVTVSIGLAWLREGEALEAVMERADTVLFLSKEGGRNRVTIDL